MKQRRRYRLIYRIVVLGLIWCSIAANIPKAAAATSSKRLLTQGDFKYIGAFDMPDYFPNGGDPQFNKGLTYRYVNGELHMFSVSWNPQILFEVKVPSYSVGAPIQQAQVVRNWGDIAGDKNLGAIFGLYWDEQDKRMYWNSQNEYNTQNPDDPGVNYSVLDNTTGIGTPIGSWRFTGRGTKATNTCVLPIPQWFADLYTGGRRLGAGCGGYQSIITIGPVHLGPALAAFSPPNIASNPDSSSLSYVNLVGYPFQNNPIDCTKRATRDTNYIDDFDGCNPVNGVGRWSWSDRLWQSAVWIDLPDKTGLVYFPTLVSGREWYETSTLHGMGATHWWYVYDPADLAAVTQGQKQQWEIQAKYTWAVQYEGLSYPLPRWDGGDPSIQVNGVAFDPSTRRLYVGVSLAGKEYGLYGTTKVYVYEVQSGTTSDATPPAAPTGLRKR
jgi:hypothetical protein